MVFLGKLYIVLENEERWIWTIFGKNGKPYFWPKYGVFGSLYIVPEIEERWIWTIFG